jgi:hypothetical protein
VELAPEAGPRSCKTSALSCDADVLAGEASADDIDGDSIGSQSLCCEGAYVVVAGDAWPVLGEDSPGVRFALAEGDGTHAGSLKAEAESTDA